MSYAVINAGQDGKAEDISSLVNSIRWGGDMQGAARHLEVDLVYGTVFIPKRMINLVVPLGSQLTLLGDKGEIIRATAFTAGKSTAGAYSLTAYDRMVYLLKSTATYIFRGMTADAIARKICADYSMPYGDLCAPGVVLPKLILRDMTLYDMLIIAYTESMKRNGQKYHLRMIEGKLNVIARSKQKVRWVISADTDLSEAQVTESIEEMRNRIVIRNDADAVVAKVEDIELIKLYGLLQHQQTEGDATSGEARTIAQTLFKQMAQVSREASLSCLGIDKLQAGDAIEVYEPITGLSGTYYVDSDEHAIEDGQHTMDLTLSWTDDVLQKDAPTE